MWVHVVTLDPEEEYAVSVAQPTGVHNINYVVPGERCGGSLVAAGFFNHASGSSV